jgi:hypothetical protein
MTPHEDLPFSAAADRNKGPILEVLARVLPAQASVLEIASGTGQHAAHFAASRPAWNWQPSDAEASSLPVIARRCAELANVRPPLRLDVLAWPWPEAVGQGLDAVVCANMLHISAWPTCAALMKGAQRCLRPGAALVVYGPFLVDGEPTSAGNLAFDADLRARNPDWGLRRLADVAHEAARFGLTLEQRVPMPANNLTLVFRAAAAPR